MDDLNKKDPYLSELDAMDNFEPPPSDLGHDAEETVHETDEPTRIDLKAPPLPKSPPAEPQVEAAQEGLAEDEEHSGDVPGLEGSEPVREILDLSPDMTVPLVIVMGRRSFTVKDLLALRIGQVMDLERSPTEPVDLVAAGKVIGKGELVDVDGKLGIRVLKLLK